MKFKIERVFFPMFLCFALVLLTHVPLHALTFTWGGAPISGEAGEEYPDFFPEGSAEFNLINSETLQLILTYTGTGSSEPLSSVNQVLTALTWDLEGFTGRLDADSAVIADGSDLVLDPVLGPDAFNGDDLSGQWAFKDDINTVDLGGYGVGAIGDINFGEDTFGSGDIINDSLTQYSPVPNGVDFGLVPMGMILPSKGGFQNQGPFVANSMIFNFEYDGEITLGMFKNVTPLFGSDGAAPVPEPATILLIGTGLLGIIGFGRKRLNKKA